MVKVAPGVPNIIQFYPRDGGARPGRYEDYLKVWPPPSMITFAAKLNASRLDSQGCT